MARLVTMADFYSLRDAGARLEQGTAQGASLALDGCRIIEVAEQQGQEDFAKRFADTTVAQLSTFKQSLFDDFTVAASRFTGEQPVPCEPFESYLLRINEVIEDSSGMKLHLMMLRNGVTLVNDGS